MELFIKDTLGLVEVSFNTHYIVLGQRQYGGVLNSECLLSEVLVLCTTVHVTSVFLYGAPLAQRTSCLAQHSSLFGPDGAVNHDYIVTNSITSLLIGLKCIPNGTY